jgi:hypothetical protein
MGRLAFMLALSLSAVSIGGCGHTPYAISGEDRHRFAAGLIDVPQPGKPPLIEGLDNCIVYKAQYDGDRISAWKATLGADWGGSYPSFMTACVDESIAYKNGEVRVYLCARAIGAGGGCNNGGNYKGKSGERPWLVSRDGRHWFDLPQ